MVPSVGFVTRGRGVTIHRAGCANVARLAAERVVAADWGFPARATVVHAMPPVCVEFDRRAQGYESCTAVAQETRDAVANVRKMLDDEAQRDPDGAVATCQAALDMIGNLPPCP